MQRLETFKNWRFAAAIWILLITLFRIYYVGWLTPFDLAQDEAHYWDWARHLDWSYYSKGPLVAWLMYSTQKLFSTLSLTLTGSEVLAIRFPAIVFGAFFLVAIYWLTLLTYKRDSLAFYTTLIISILPATTAGGILMTIDSPFVCFWAWSILFGFYALFREKAWAWPLLGLTLGLGILAKYTMVMWPASALLFCFFTPAFRRFFKQPGIWICAGMVAFCCLPILIWNIQNDWVSLKHVAGQAGFLKEKENDSKTNSNETQEVINENKPKNIDPHYTKNAKPAEKKPLIRWLGPIEYIGAQLGVGVVIFGLIWAGGMWYALPLKPNQPDTTPEQQYLWWLSAPTFAFFFVVSFRVGIQANWPIAGFVSGLILAAGWFEPLYQTKRWAKVTLAIGCIFAFLASLAALNPRPLTPIMSKILGPDQSRKWDPTCRLRGWKWLAGEVQKYRQEIEQKEGKPAILATDRWNIAGQIGFYSPDKPHVLSVGRATGDRYSQYDLWKPNPIDTAQDYLGKTFIMIGEPKDEYPLAFEKLDPPIRLEYRENGELIAWWYISIGKGYQGFPTKVKSGRY